MENKDSSQEATNFKKMVRDWGIQHSSLEEVFMKITRENNFSN